MTGENNVVAVQMLLDEIETPAGVLSQVSGTMVPLDASAVFDLSDRLVAAGQMYVAGSVGDADFVEVVRQLVTACEMASVLRHEMNPARLAAHRDSLAGEIFDAV